MKKVICLTAVFLISCLITTISVDADSNSKFLYLNNISVSSRGYTTETLNKTEKGFQFLRSNVNKAFIAYLNGNDSNGSYGTSVNYKIIANHDGAINNSNSSEYNYGFGVGNTSLKLVSPVLWSRTFQGAWIPDQTFYELVKSSGLF